MPARPSVTVDQARPPLGRAQLTAIVRTAAAGDWASFVRYTPHQRWYLRLDRGSDHEVWLLSWLPGQGTGFHDHGGSAGVFTVVQGELQERTLRGTGLATWSTLFAAGAVRPFGPRHVHDVGNVSAVPAVSIHAYSPPLAEMRRYQLTQGGLVRAALEKAGERW